MAKDWVLATVAILQASPQHSSIPSQQGCYTCRAAPLFGSFHPRSRRHTVEHHRGQSDPYPTTTGKERRNSGRQATCAATANSRAGQTRRAFPHERARAAETGETRASSGWSRARGQARKQQTTSLLTSATVRPFWFWIFDLWTSVFC